MNTEQILSRQDRESIVSEAEKFHKKQRKRAKLSLPVMVPAFLFLAYQAALYAYRGTQYYVYYYHLVYLIPMLFCAALIMVFIGKRSKAVKTIEFVQQSRIAQRSDYSVQADLDGITDGTESLKWADAQHGFLVKDYIIVTGRKSAFALKAEYELKQQFCSVLEKHRKPVAYIDSSKENILICKRQIFRETAALMRLMAVFMVIPISIFRSIPKPVTDNILQPRSEYRYSAGKSLAKQMKNVVGQKGNIGYRFDIYFDYINRNYNTLIKTEYGTDGAPGAREIWFFSGEKEDLYLGIGTGEDDTTEIISTLKNNSEINISQYGDYFIMEAGNITSLPWTDWNSRFKKALEYDTVIFNFEKLKKNSTFMGSYRLTLVNSENTSQKAKFRFTEETVSLTAEGSSGEKVSCEIIFCNTPQDRIQHTITLADTLRGKARNPAAAKIADYDALKADINSYFE